MTHARMIAPGIKLAELFAWLLRRRPVQAVPAGVWDGEWEAAMKKRYVEAEQIIEGMERFSERNWDGDGAAPVTKEARQRAQSLLRVVRDEGVPVPAVTACADGAVQFSWVFPSGPRRLEIEAQSHEDGYTLQIGYEDEPGFLVDSALTDTYEVAGRIRDHFRQLAAA